MLGGTFVLLLSLIGVGWDADLSVSVVGAPGFEKPTGRWGLFGSARFDGLAMLSLFFPLFPLVLHYCFFVLFCICICIYPE